MAIRLNSRRRRWHILIRLIKEHGWAYGAELGVFRGQNLLNLVMECPDLHMVGVDLWKAQTWQEPLRAAGGRSYADVDLGAIFKGLKIRINEGGYEDRVELFRMSTSVAASGLNNEIMRGGRPLFDFVFVDADHMEAGVREDIIMWEPMVRPGGMVLGHDYQATFPGVMKAVDDIFPKRKLYTDSVWGMVV